MFVLGLFPDFFGAQHLLKYFWTVNASFGLVGK